VFTRDVFNDPAHVPVYEAAAEGESVSELMLVAADNLILILGAGTASHQRRGVGPPRLSDMAAGNIVGRRQIGSSAGTGILIEHAAIRGLERERADRNVRRHFLKKTSPVGEELALAVAGGIEYYAHARRPIVPEHIPGIRAGQSLLLESQSRLDGDAPADIPTVLHETRVVAG